MKYSNLKEFKKANIFGTGIPNFILKGNMTGKSYIKPIKMANGIMLANVTFRQDQDAFGMYIEQQKVVVRLLSVLQEKASIRRKEKKLKHLSQEIPYLLSLV